MDAARLKDINVFSSLSDEDLETLARLATETNASDGDVLLEAGGSSDKLWIIEDGQVEVERDGDVVATLGPGDIVGETGVLERKLRNANVKAKGSITALVLAQSDVRRLRKEHPDLDERLQKVLEDRSD